MFAVKRYPSCQSYHLIENDTQLNNQYILNSISIWMGKVVSLREHLDSDQCHCDKTILICDFCVRDVSSTF